MFNLVHTLQSYSMMQLELDAGHAIRRRSQQSSVSEPADA